MKRIIPKKNIISIKNSLTILAFIFSQFVMSASKKPPETSPPVDTNKIKLNKCNDDKNKCNDQKVALNQKISTLNSDKERLNSRIESLNSSISTLNQDILDLNGIVQKVTQEKTSCNNTLASCNSSKEQKSKEYTKNLKKYESENQDLFKKIGEQQDTIKNLNLKIVDHDLDLKKHNNLADKIKNENEGYKIQVKNLSDELKEQRKKVITLQDEIINLEKIKGSSSNVANNELLNEKTKLIKEKDILIEQKNDEIKRLQALVQKMALNPGEKTPEKDSNSKVTCPKGDKKCMLLAEIQSCNTKFFQLENNLSLCQETLTTKSFSIDNESNCEEIQNQLNSCNEDKQELLTQMLDQENNTKNEYENTIKNLNDQLENFTGQTGLTNLDPAGPWNSGSNRASKCCNVSAQGGWTRCLTDGKLVGKLTAVISNWGGIPKPQPGAPVTSTTICGNNDGKGCPMFRLTRRVKEDFNFGSLLFRFKDNRKSDGDIDQFMYCGFESSDKGCKEGDNISTQILTDHVEMRINDNDLSDNWGSLDVCFMLYESESLVQRNLAIKSQIISNKATSIKNTIINDINNIDNKIMNSVDRYKSTVKQELIQYLRDYNLLIMEPPSRDEVDE